MERPARSSSYMEHPARSSSYMEHPARSSSYMERPARSSSYMEHPARSSSYMEHPAQSSSYMECPAQSSSYMERPARSSSYMEHPARSSSYMERPARSSSYMEHPAQSSSYMEHPAQSSSYMERPARSSSYIGAPSSVHLLFPSNQTHYHGGPTRARLPFLKKLGATPSSSFGQQDNIWIPSQGKWEQLRGNCVQFGKEPQGLGQETSPCGKYSPAVSRPSSLPSDAACPLTSHSGRFTFKGILHRIGQEPQWQISLHHPRARNSMFCSCQLLVRCCFLISQNMTPWEMQATGERVFLLYFFLIFEKEVPRRPLPRLVGDQNALLPQGLEPQQLQMGLPDSRVGHTLKCESETRTGSALWLKSFENIRVKSADEIKRNGRTAQRKPRQQECVGVCRPAPETDTPGLPAAPPGAPRPRGWNTLPRLPVFQPGRYIITFILEIRKMLDCGRKAGKPGGGAT
ncbi:Variable charge X-linked protein 3B [Manis javanica]|nr:Variable charge X-linked protein 3B [Manis javanica]